MSLKVTAVAGGNVEKSYGLFSFLKQEREPLDGYRVTTPSEHRAKEFARCRAEFFCVLHSFIFGSDYGSCLKGNTCRQLSSIVKPDPVSGVILCRTKK